MANRLKPDWMRVEEIKHLKEQRQLDNLVKEDLKMAKKSNYCAWLRRLKSEGLETELEKSFLKESEQSCFDQRFNNYSPELVALKEEEIKSLKLRQQIWESSSELKDLKVKLQSAYTAKEVAAQIAEKKARSQQDKMEHQLYFDAMNERERLMKEQEEKIVQEAYKKKLHYREELQSQMIQSCNKENKYQEFMNEKALLDQIVRAIHEEDQREEEQHMERIKRTKREIEEFRQLQDSWRRLEKQALDEEERRIKSYLEQRDQEEQKRIVESKQAKEMKTHLQERIQATYVSQHIPMNKKKERLDVLNDLWAEEIKEKDLIRAKQEMESALRKREELKIAFRQHLADKRKQLEEEELQEKLYSDQMLAEFATNARFEQLSTEKRRLKNLEHKRQLQELLTEKQRQRAEEWKQLHALEELRQREEKQRAQIIEEERIRLLKKHATKLLGYLPKGVLREDDLTHLGSDFLTNFLSLKAQ